MPESVIIPNWEIPDEEVRFPEGFYLCALGKIKPVYPDNDHSAVPEAVLNDIWVIKYQGSDLNPVNDIRINIGTDNTVQMGTHGTKITERYPSPAKMPNMAWRMRAFFSKFDCVVEKEVGSGDAKKTVKVVDWELVQQKYGEVFRMFVLYQKAKSGGKRYRNIDYELIELSGQRVPADKMQAIEQKYNALKAMEEAAKERVEGGAGEGEAPPGVEDLPF